MEKINLGYSIKNIPIPSEKSYLMQLVEKIEAVIKRMRLKATFFEKDDEDEEKDIPEWYGLLIKFRKIKNDFQKKLSDDIKMISSTGKTVTPADKTSNMYRLEKGEYEKLLHDSITTTYKKASSKLESKINTAGKKFAKDAKILDKMEINAKNDCFITLKDHKENFLNNLKTRLINSAKNETGRISKVILDKINKELIKKTEHQSMEERHKRNKLVQSYREQA